MKFELLNGTSAVERSCQISCLAACIVLQNKINILDATTFIFNEKRMEKRLEAE